MQSNKDLYTPHDEGVVYDWMNPLLTDMYQIKMTYASWKGKRHEDIATFEMFFRKCPFKGKYAIFCGHEEVYKFLSAFKFTPQHIEYLKLSIP
jgi:nicotinate phosphoribosyltransferase